MSKLMLLWDVSPCVLWDVSPCVLCVLKLLIPCAETHSVANCSCCMASSSG